MRLPMATVLRSVTIVSGVYAAGLLAPAAAQGPALAMLGALDDGKWELRFRDGSESRSICVRSGYELIQIQHGPASCSRFVVDDSAREITVQYTCRGNGYGRTTIRKENAGLVQIDSQGIAAGLPFDFSAEARRIADCE